jgi:hypothetical protein
VGGNWADSVYRSYFTAGILTVLTAGATWGAWLLVKIGWAGSFFSSNIQDINAHGQAQIYGWMGFFIMGFSYQAFPRKWHTELKAPALAAAALAAMIAGIALRTAGMVLADGWGAGVGVSMIGCALQLASILVFSGQMVATFRRSLVRFEPYIGFIFSAIFWFIAMAGLDLWHTYATLTVPGRAELLWHVATFQAPLRDMQIHGLGLMMILGVSIRIFPGLYRLPHVPARRAWWALALLNTAVAGECLLFVIYRLTSNHVLAAFLMIPWIMLCVGVVMLVLPWRLWRPFEVRDRSGKFIRAAFGWLALSLLMLLALPAQLHLSGMPFSHAYYGAIRHAITVGFVSMMIVGVASKVVPALGGIDPRKLSALTGPFILLNLGCLLRVTFQTLTDFYPSVFMVLGISGTLEVTALAWWGIGLIHVMRAGKRAARERELSERIPHVDARRNAPEPRIIAIPASA